jgi:beta-exotoxin I transport system permease protein
MISNLFLKTLRDQWRAVLGWGVGLAALGFVTLLFFPQMSGLEELNQLLESMPQLAGFLGDIASFTTLEGYVTSQLLAYVPVIVAIYGIFAGTNTITGELESGTIDTLMSHPIPRWRVVLEKYGALALSLLGICVITGLGLWVGGLTIGEDVPFQTWILAGLNMWPIILLYSSVALGLACAVRGRGIPIGVASALAVGGFILNGLVPLVDSLKPYREFTIYYLYLASKPFSEGINLGYSAIPLAGSLLFLLLGLVAFNRRDLLA